MADAEAVTTEPRAFLDSAPTFRAQLVEAVVWVIFLAMLALLLRPILLTTVAADDLINPFSQIFHAGTGIDPILRRTWHYVSITGHFNYVGQSIGSFVLLIWAYLIGNFNIRYSTIYSVTRFIVYTLTILVSAQLLRMLLKTVDIHVSKWSTRFLILLGLGFTLQIHVPWSNDPVASYPLSGYLTASVGLAAVVMFLRVVEQPTKTKILLASLTGVFGVLYYEYNLFAVLAVGPLIIDHLWRVRRDAILLRHWLVRYSVVVGPAMFTTIYFYLRNRAASAAYTGTAISYAGDFVPTFVRGLVSALPFSSWSIATDWLDGPFTWSPGLVVTPLVVAAVGGAAVFLNSRDVSHETTTSRTRLRRVIVMTSPLFIYWFGTTFTQTSTVKVQQESNRIGHVYNYYAVGSIVSVMIVIFLVMSLGRTPFKPRLIGLLSAVLILGGIFQWAMNWNVMTKFNGVMSGSRNLLVAVTDQPDMSKRCEALDIWKSMGWPEYYWLDMELGLSRMYEIYRDEEFCQR